MIFEFPLATSKGIVQQYVEHVATVLKWDVTDVIALINQTGTWPDLDDLDILDWGHHNINTL